MKVRLHSVSMSIYTKDGEVETDRKGILQHMVDVSLYIVDKNDNIY